MTVWHRIFDFTDYGQLLSLVHNSILAGLVLGVVGGLISTFVMMRDLPFAVHGISELSFAGASAGRTAATRRAAGRTSHLSVTRCSPVARAWRLQVLYQTQPGRRRDQRRDR